MSASSAFSSNFEVLAIVTSAGGLEAMSIVLADLPEETPAAVVVGQHLGAESTLPEILSRRTRLQANWARDGETLRLGRIYVAPPLSRLELLPDHSVTVSPLERPLLQDRPLDALLESIADSYGPRALVVVLTGMGVDGAEGARAVKRAGGGVLVQRVTEAAFQELPRAAVQAGAADLELSLTELGRTVVDLMSGARFPKPRNEAEACDALFHGVGAAREAMRAVDWCRTAIGPVLEWPRTLTSVVGSMLDVRLPMCAAWGNELIQIYNDSWIALVGERHPDAAGQSLRTALPALWPSFAPRIRRVMESGEPLLVEDCRIDTHRRGFLEETYFTTSYSPLRDDRGAVRGVLLLADERTVSVLGQRRLETLRRLAEVNAEQVSVACERVAAVVEENPHDLPFLLLYVVDTAGHRATLSACAGLRTGPMAPRSVGLLEHDAPWPLGRAIRQNRLHEVQGMTAQLRGQAAIEWDATPDAAMVGPLLCDGGTGGAVVVLGLSPRLALDEGYRGFLEGVAKQVGITLGQAQLRERGRERLQQLSTLDRARTEFFSNVSHEFRTPLTLLLAPLEDMLAARDDILGPMRRELELASRNARRLLGLVDTLLDFSRIEAGRLRARFEPLELSELTADVASLFRSAAERAGLTLEVNCPPAPRAVNADADMWEKVVSNLLSNALKFTFEGTISVSLTYLPQHVQLKVSDTGIGIAEQEQAQIFHRFHRVRGVRARTDEGAGIGLSIVAELVRLHHGRVRVSSQPDQGSTFTVWVPMQEGRRPTPSGARSTGSHDAAVRMAHEAEAWGSASDGRAPAGIVESMLGPASRTLPTRAFGLRVLVADDNADMRDYLARILGQYWKIALAGDGAEALARARADPPDLILADVMMPLMDGFALLRELRADRVLRSTPVILVTARAHEEAAIEGLLAGADDYVAKPFSSRELVARIVAQLELAGARRRSERELRELLSAMPVGVYACDLDGRFSYWNRRAAELWGAEPVPEARDWALLGAPQAIDRDGLPLEPQASSMARVLRHGENVADAEVMALRADGSRLNLLINILPLRVDGQQTGAVCAFLDVTARKAAEYAKLEARNQELERFSRIVVGRELRMIELKQQVNALRKRLGEAPGYPLDFGLEGVDRIVAGPPSLSSSAIGAEPFVEEALRWLSEEPLGGTPDREPAASVLLADDNADMRSYVTRLLAPHYHVTVATDGAAALEAAQARPPDLLIADIMMPGMDGLELLRAMRTDPRMQETPVILLSARAGEESKVVGLDAGADDYLVKPFTDRELLARVRAQLGHTLERRTTSEKLSARLIDLEHANAEIRDARRATLNVLEDVVEARDRAEHLYREVREREAWLAGESRALEAALDGASLEIALGFLVPAATARLGGDARVAFYLADRSGTELHHVVGMPADYADAVDGFRIGPESLACGLATHSGRPVLTRDVFEDPLWKPWRWLAERFGYRGCWSFPIHTAAGTFVGSFAVYWPAPRDASDREIEFAKHVTHVAAIMISRQQRPTARERAKDARA
jgi:PAS domain S-box-containing protein